MDALNTRTKSLLSGLGAIVLSLSLLPLPADAQMKGRKGRGLEAAEGASGAEKPMSDDGVERRDKIIAATGLKPAFTEGFRCDPVSSPFGSPTRYDGSMRRGDRNSGLHGGLDITLPEGTPLLATAAGEVIATGEGGRLEGIFLWLRHAPEDTGLSFWVFSKYQHLSKLPELQPGTRVAAGDIVALSGNSGTAGGHYGMFGYPHLHLTTLYAPSARYMMRGAYASMAASPESIPHDPLLLYRSDLNHLDQVRAYAAENGTVNVPIVDGQGAIHPAGSKRVWPVRCKRD